MAKLRARFDGLPTPDLDEVARVYRPLAGRVVVQMGAIKREKRGILVPDRSAKRFNANVGVVIACRPRPLRDSLGEFRRGLDGAVLLEEMDIAPGDAVVVHPLDGKKVAGAVFGSYRPETRCVYFGVFSRTRGESMEMPWTDSIYGKLDMEGQRVIPVGTKVTLDLGKKMEQSRGGLLLPDRMVVREDVARVVAVGAQVGQLEPDVRPGVRVVYENRAIERMWVDDLETEMAMVDIAGIHGVIDGDA